MWSRAATRRWSPGRRCCRFSSRAANNAIYRYGRRSSSSARCGMTGHGIRCLVAPFRCLKKYGRNRRRRALKTFGGVTSWTDNTPPSLVIRCKCGFALDEPNEKVNRFRYAAIALTYILLRRRSDVQRNKFRGSYVAVRIASRYSRRRRRVP